MSNGEPHPADYTGLHAFLFIDHVAEGTNPEEVVRKLRELGKPPIMYASTFVGEFVAFAHVRVESLGALQDLIESDIPGTGARCHWSLESGGVGTFGAKRRSPGLIALVRAKLTDPRRVRAVHRRLAEREGAPGFEGVSPISGQWDLLLQMTGSDPDDAQTNLENLLADFDGEFARTSTSFADGDRTEARHG
jgi:DNA-binding Lrp family transcriptional regulator